tara:strand:- start:3553 stop:4170 length:618 start_codon:yes stop_codon:yes gene_type:complete
MDDLDNDIVDITEGEDLPDDFGLHNAEEYNIPLLSEDQIPEILRRLDYYRAKENKVREKAEIHIEKARTEANTYVDRELTKTHHRRLVWNQAIAEKFLSYQKDSVRSMNFPNGSIKRRSVYELVVVDETKALEELREACPAAVKTVPEQHSIISNKALKYCKETGDVLDDAIKIEGRDSYTVETTETRRLKEEKKAQHTLTQKED